MSKRILQYTKDITYILASDGWTDKKISCSLGLCIDSIQKILRQKNFRRISVDNIRRRLLLKSQRNLYTGCIEWIGSLHYKGYGEIRINGKTKGAHVIVWKLHHGNIPFGMFVCHKCDNPKCINIDHLFLGTPKDNTHDMIAKGRMCCGSKVRNAKLKENDIQHIRQLHQDGYTNVAICKIFHISSASISRIVNRKTWRHI